MSALVEALGAALDHPITLGNVLGTCAGVWLVRRFSRDDK